MKTKLSILAFFLFLSGGCDLKDISSPDSVLGARDSAVSSVITKWYDNHSAAIVITNDAGLADPKEYQVQEFAHSKEVVMNYEMVTSGFVGNQDKIDKIFNQLFKFGHGIYGHGHWHYNHDQLNYDEAYNSFYKCFKSMDSLELGVVTYAYPGGNGYKLRTRDALKDAGFLAGRYFDQLGHLDPYIVPEDETTPRDWYSLPTLVMQDYGYDACDICINNTAELIPFLDKTIELNALIIITYHAIDQYNQYGFYNFENYKKDIIAVSERDFWTARFNDAVLYIYQRESAEAEVIWHFNEDEIVDEISVTVSDQFGDNETYNQPLTLLFDVPLHWKDKKIKVTQENKLIFEMTGNSTELKISLPPDESTYKLELK